MQFLREPSSHQKSATSLLLQVNKFNLSKVLNAHSSIDIGGSANAIFTVDATVQVFYIQFTKDVEA